MAHIVVKGNAISDFELRFGQSGKAWGTVTLAENHFKREASGEWVKEGTSWYRVTCFGKRAEDAAEVVVKGSRLLVVGQLRIKDFERKDGTKGTAAEIVADDVAVIPTVSQKSGPTHNGWGAA